MAIPLSCTVTYNEVTDDYTAKIVFNGNDYYKKNVSKVEASNYITEFIINIQETQSEYQFETCINYQ